MVESDGGALFFAPTPQDVGLLAGTGSAGASVINMDAAKESGKSF